MMGDGDGWVHCARRHRHWGRFGAAGLLLRRTDPDGVERVLLQHRAPRSHHGDTWGILGGARDSGESAQEAAAREAAEEAGLPGSDWTVLGEHVDDHGGWSYTTVIARAAPTLEPGTLTWESVEVRWVAVAEVVRLALHPGFAAAWPSLAD